MRNIVLGIAVLGCTLFGFQMGMMFTPAPKIPVPTTDVGRIKAAKGSTKELIKIANDHFASSMATVSALHKEMASRPRKVLLWGFVGGALGLIISGWGAMFLTRRFPDHPHGPGKPAGGLNFGGS